MSFSSVSFELAVNSFHNSAFEEALDRHAAHPALEPTYNPSLLRRAPALADDISHLLQVPVSTWQSHPVHLKLQSAFPAPLTAYVARIRTLADSANPTALLAHSYVRYLGDLSGGQTIRRTIAKAYNLDESDGLGLKFYEFREQTGSGIANQGEMKRIKEWFREGMNTAGNIGVEVKGKMNPTFTPVSKVMNDVVVPSSRRV
jgi:heme oxygenase